MRAIKKVLPGTKRWHHISPRTKSPCTTSQCPWHGGLSQSIHDSTLPILWNGIHEVMDVGNLISDSSAFSKSSLTIWKFTVHALLKPGLENFKHYFASVWDECNWLIAKDPDAGRDWGQEEKGMTEDEMAGWHHRLNADEFGWTRSSWWTGRPGVLRFMGWQRVRQDWATELNWVLLYMKGLDWPKSLFKFFCNIL